MNVTISTVLSYGMSFPLLAEIIPRIDIAPKEVQSKYNKNCNIYYAVVSFLIIHQKSVLNRICAFKIIYL